MKKYDIIFSALKLPLDFIIVFSSFFLARSLRLGTESFLGLNVPFQTIDTENLLFFAIFGSILFIFIFAIHGLYFIKISSSKISEILKIILYSFYWVVIFSFFAYLGIDIIFKVSIPRLIIIFAFLITTILVILERVLLNNIEYFLLKKGFLDKKKLLIVNNKQENKIKEILDDVVESKIYNIIGYTNKIDIKLENLKYVGNIEDIYNLFERKKCDEVLYIDSDYNKKELYDLWELTRIFGIRYRYITNSFDVSKTNTTLSLISKIPVIEIKNTSLDNWAKIFKRIFDFIVGFFGIIILSPIILIVSILIKIDDPKGPIFYKNRRIGKGGKVFTLYKFRYMKWEYSVKDAYEDIKDDNALEYEKELIKNNSTRKGPLYKIKNDPRKTKIGNFIEKYSIDEIPQFFNLIIGNMSLVGPRPHQPREVENYSIKQKRLFTIKPGITGMAQVNGREKNDFKKEAELDIFYIENWSALLDLKIILKTFSVIFSRK